MALPPPFPIALPLLVVASCDAPGLALSWAGGLPFECRIPTEPAIPVPTLYVVFAATVAVHTQQSEFTLSTSNYRSRYYWECPTCCRTCRSCEVICITENRQNKSFSVNALLSSLNPQVISLRYKLYFWISQRYSHIVSPATDYVIGSFGCYSLNSSFHYL
jgi:hypothetical protein